MLAATVEAQKAAMGQQGLQVRVGTGGRSGVLHYGYAVREAHVMQAAFIHMFTAKHPSEKKLFVDGWAGGMPYYPRHLCI